MKKLQDLFGSAVRHHRMKRGLTQSQLAEAIKRSTDMVSRIKRGDTAPSFETITKICEALQVSPAALFGGSDDAGLPRPDPLTPVRETSGDMSPAETAWSMELLRVARARPKS